MRRYSSRTGRGMSSVVLSLFLIWMVYKVFPELAGTPPAPSPQPATVDAAAEAAPAAANGTGRVVKVVDGDTLDVEVNNETLRIRVIGVNTPETVDPRRPVQCFGREASAKAHELLDDAEVVLTADPTQDDVDRYGRNLRYVEIVGMGDYGVAMIGGGYAHEYTYERAYQKQADYRAAQRSAEEQKLGLWHPDTCNGDTNKAVQ